MDRYHPANLRAAWWAFRSARRTRRLLNQAGLDPALYPPPPPALPAEAVRGVHAALRRCRETCLVNSIVLQTWKAAHGDRRDLVIGTTGPGRFHAHAWLQGDAVPSPDAPGFDGSGIITADIPAGTVDFKELLRRPAPDHLGNSVPAP